MADARQHPRYAVEVAVRLDLGDLSVEGRSRNLSRGGMSAYTADAVPLGAEGTAQLALVLAPAGGDASARSEPLELPVRIVWCTPIGDEHQLGAAFLTLTREQMDTLELFLRYLDEGRARGDDAAPNDPFAS